MYVISRIRQSTDVQPYILYTVRKCEKMRHDTNSVSGGTIGCCLLQWRHMRASQITSVSMVCSSVCSGADQRKHQSSPSLAFEGNSPMTGEFLLQRASNAKNVSIWWRHHVMTTLVVQCVQCIYTNRRTFTGIPPWNSVSQLKPQFGVPIMCV